MIALSERSKMDAIRKAIQRCRGDPHVIDVSYEGVNTRRLE